MRLSVKNNYIIQMNRSIAKTRNQLQRITLKINQLKTKYTGDVYMHSNAALESSPISSHTPSQNQTQFRQSQKQYQRPRDIRQGSSFPLKPTQMSGSKNFTLNNTQLYSQNQSQSQPQIQTYIGNEQLYQKQFKIFRNEIFNYIDRCIVVSKQKQQQIIQKTLEKFAQKQKALVNQSTKSKINLQQRIKKIQQQTTNCLTNIQDLLVQVKKNEKYTNQKISSQESKTKKQIQQLYIQLKKISGIDVDGNIPITIDQINMKLIALQKAQKQLKQQSIKQSKKLNNVDDIFQQINIKIQNLESRTNKKITQNFNIQEELIVKRSQSLFQDITKYHQFNVMLQKQILEIKTRQQQSQLQAHKNEQNEQSDITKLKQEISLQIQQKVNGLQENLQKNLTDLASLAESFLTLENRLQQTLTSQINLKQVLEVFEQKLSSIQSETQNFKNSQILLKIQSKNQFLEEISEKISKMSIQLQDKLKKSIELQKEQLKFQINEQSSKKGKTNEDIQSSIIEKLSILINKHQEQIIKKMIQNQQRMIKVQQIEHMFNDFKNKLCEEIEAQISNSLTIHEQNMIQKIKSQQIITNSLSVEGIQQIEASLSQKVIQQMQEKLKSFMIKIETNFEDKYKEINKEKLNNIQCHHDDLSEQMLAQIQNKVKKCVFEDFDSIKVHISKIQNKIIEICNHLQSNQKLMIIQPKQLKPDCNTNTIRRNDTLQSSQIASQQQRNSPKTQDIMQQKRATQIIQEKLTQFQNDINQTIKLLYEDIQNKVNDVVNGSGIVEFKTHFQMFKSEVSSLSTLVNSLILMNQTKSQQHQHKNIQNQLTIVKNQISRNSSQIYTQMSIQIAKISTVLQKACEEVQIKVQKLDRNFSYMYQRLSNIEYDNAHFKDKLSYFLSSKGPNTTKIESKLIIEPKSENASNILDVLGKFSVGKPDIFETN